MHGEGVKHSLLKLEESLVELARISFDIASEGEGNAETQEAARQAHQFALERLKRVNAIVRWIRDNEEG